MKIIAKHFKILFLLFAIATLPTACVHKPLQEYSPPLLKYELQTEIMFRGWDTKNYTDKVPFDKITLITQKGLTSDIVILRWNQPHTKFTTEIYHPEDGDSILKTWVSGVASVKKSVVQQPVNVLHIIERVTGADGGERVEVIKLPKM